MIHHGQHANGNESDWLDYAQAVGSLATALALVVAVVVAWITWVAAKKSQDLSVAHEGAQAATAWRDQVFALYDRGLSPEQIQRIMLLEDGGEGYETSNGRIADILADVPRVS